MDAPSEWVARWEEIPAVPIAAFKEAVLACEPVEQAVSCFQSSGTTGDKRSRHYHPSLAVYDYYNKLDKTNIAVARRAAEAVAAGAPVTATTK